MNSKLAIIIGILVCFGIIILGYVAKFFEGQIEEEVYTSENEAQGGSVGAVLVIGGVLGIFIVPIVVIAKMKGWI